MNCWKKIGIWCNGNTTDSGPVFPGSSPGIPTIKERLFTVSLFLHATPIKKYYVILGQVSRNTLQSIT